MKIDHKLIEKYHLGQCSPTEKILVEEWLLDDTLDSEPLSISIAKKTKLETDIWDQLSAHIDQSDVPATIPQKKYSFKYIGVAATIVFLLCFGFYWFGKDSGKAAAIFENRTSTGLKYINQNNYNIILGKHASAEINTDTGEFKTSGNMMFIPKKNFAFSFSGTDKKKEFKHGEIYFVLKPQKNGKQVIISKSELTFLAPTIQHELKIQFNII
ncbi:MULTISPECIES: hypothetical protein [Sphingobacterium]|uniref:hypothetical protein n=1 Tax=Sphingobacterium TaxID=28453 RepID=UPI001AE1D706|nr:MULTISPECIES: hypothetical protein [Sphingobacterium]MDR6735863.1 hypothetical protein [Sphingobacterium sp. 2149]